VNHLTAAQAICHCHSPYAIAHLPLPMPTLLPPHLHFHLAALASSSLLLSLSELLPSDHAVNTFLDCILVAFVPLCPTPSFHYSTPCLSIYLEHRQLSLHSLSLFSSPLTGSILHFELTQIHLCTTHIVPLAADKFCHTMKNRYMSK
jgi:hypothetical protein